MIDTHAHIDAPEFADDVEVVIQNAKDAGVDKIFIPNINLNTIDPILQLCNSHKDYLYPMIGFHPEDVNDEKLDVETVLSSIKSILEEDSRNDRRFIAIGEVGLDFYWDQTFKDKQIYVFERQVDFATQFSLPLMIHCRNAHDDMVNVIKKYDGKLTGVFHCFTGNELQAEKLLEFDGFMLGIGGVMTFKKSNLPDVLKHSVPLNRIVLETDSPYMAPVPMRGKRNEPAFVRYVADKLADVYNLETEYVIKQTDENVNAVFNL